MSRNKRPFLEVVKEAFFMKIEFPMLGHVPVNLVSCMVLGLASFIWHPILILLLLGEFAYLTFMSANPVFHRYLKNKDILKEKSLWEGRKQEMLSKLSPGSRTRYRQFEETAKSIVGIYEATQKAGGYVDPTKLDVLGRLVWLSIKLLTSRELIVRNIKGSSKELLETKIKNMEKNMQTETNERILKTLESTIDTMRKRLQSLNSINDKIKGIDLELLRIEEQLALLYNVATIDTSMNNNDFSEQIDLAQLSIREADEWMKDNTDLFSSLGSAFDEQPPIEILSTERTI